MRDAIRLLSVGLWICLWVGSLLGGVLALAEYTRPTLAGILLAIPAIVFGGIFWLHVIFGGGLLLLLEIDERLLERRS